MNTASWIWVTSRHEEILRTSDKLLVTMTEPDELYTLRAQFWLGHYGMAVDEAGYLSTLFDLFGIHRLPKNIGDHSAKYATIYIVTT